MSEILEVMAYASVGAALGEALSWLLVYRKPEFERLTQQIDAQQKKIDKQKEKEVAAPASKSRPRQPATDASSTQLAILPLQKPEEPEKEPEVAVAEERAAAGMPAGTGSHCQPSGAIRRSQLIASSAPASSSQVTNELWAVWRR